MRIDKHGWLETENETEPSILRFTTIRTCALASGPLGIVWHWTAGKGGKDFAENLAKSLLSFDPKKDRATSWHVLIAKNGTIYQSASFHVGTWHVGRSAIINGHKWPNVNSVLLGCELENAGELVKVNNRFYCWPYFLNPDDVIGTAQQMDSTLEVDCSRAMLFQGKFYDAYTIEQEASAKLLISALVKEFQWSQAACSYLHSKLDPTRKKDPGPLWSDEILPRLIFEVFKK